MNVKSQLSKLKCHFYIYACKTSKNLYLSCIILVLIPQSIYLQYVPGQMLQEVNDLHIFEFYFKDVELSPA